LLNTFTDLSISLDELAVGFSIGFIDVPVVTTIILIDLQDFVFTWMGLTFGSKFKPLLGEWSEKLRVLGLCEREPRSCIFTSLDKL
jgi:putative Mn2+ efflux pump MntP